MSAEATTITVTSSDATLITVNLGDSTSLSVSNSDVTSLSISNTATTAVTVSNADSTLISAAAASISVPVYVNLSDDTPLELANTGSAGTSLFAARSDHVHPSTGMYISGGNF
jgi:hypothetical protein